MLDVSTRSYSDLARTCGLVLLLLAAGRPASSVAAESAPWSAVVSPENSLQTAFLRGETPVFRLGMGGWGPNWAWVGLASKERAATDRLAIQTPFVVNRAAGDVIDVKLEQWRSAPRTIRFQYDLAAARDVPLTMLIASLGVERAIPGKIAFVLADGKQASVNLPLGRGAQPPVAKASLLLADVGRVVVTLDPPCPVSFDGDMRIMLASGVFPRGSRRITLTLAFADDIALAASQADVDRLTRTLAGPDWFPFQPSDDVRGGAIDMNDWLDRPAGKHGGVRSVGDRFQFEDGTPVKFWGVNLAYGGGCAPAKKIADLTAARFAKFGVNGVRLHKFSYPKNKMGIGDPNDSTTMDPEGLDRLDYFAAQLKQRGIYFGWSHTYNFHVCPGNRAKLVAYDEIAKNLHGDTYAFINFAEDVQDLMIEMVVKLLGHKNPYTGLTYAEEPALSFLEMQNEDDIFFYTSSGALKACPTYQRIFAGRFAQWLQAKYGSEQGLKAAWQDALKPDERLASRGIMPETNPVRAI